MLWLTISLKTIDSIHHIHGKGNLEKMETQVQIVSDSYKKVSFSRDRGQTWQRVDERLSSFDICDIKRDEEVEGMVFFSATSFEQLVKQVEKFKNQPTFYTYNDLDEEYWLQLLNRYDEAFFAHYILLFYYKAENNISENYVYSVTVKDQALTLNVNRLEGMLTALSSWKEVITIKKEDVQGVNEFHVIVRTITPLKSTTDLV